jgi:hypothetical protein
MMSMSTVRAIFTNWRLRASSFGNRVPRRDPMVGTTPAIGRHAAKSRRRGVRRPDRLVDAQNSPGDAR